MLNITTSALVVLQQALAVSHVEDPAVYLIEATKLTSVSKEEAEAIRAGADQATLRAAYERDVARRPTVPFRLKPAVYPARDFPARFLYEVEGIRVFLPPDIANRQGPVTIDVRDNELVLLDDEGRTLAPSNQDAR